MYEDFSGGGQGEGGATGEERVGDGGLRMWEAGVKQASWVWIRDISIEFTKRIFSGYARSRIKVLRQFYS